MTELKDAELAELKTPEFQFKNSEELEQDAQRLKKTLREELEWSYDVDRETLKKRRNKHETGTPSQKNSNEGGICTYIPKQETQSR